MLAPRIVAGQARRVAKIGWLGVGDPSAPSAPSVPLEGLREGLRQLGWIEGENLHIEIRNGTFDNAKDLTVALVQANVEVIVAQGGMVFRAHAFTGNTPMLFQMNGDPVEAKLVTSYSRPGGNLTGVTNLSAQLSGKRIELLKEALPHAKRIAAVANQGHPGAGVEAEATAAAAKQLGLGLEWFPVYSAKDFAGAFDGIARSGAHGLIAIPDNLILNQAKPIAEFSTARGIPVMAGFAQMTAAGSLMSYGPILRDSYVKLATYVDKLLKGAKAGDLPVENPTRFEMAINLKVAKNLKLKLPQSLLVRADRVIE
jgi:putative ABC transport system substrate-binding protein